MEDVYTDEDEGRCSFLVRYKQDNIQMAELQTINY